MRHIDYFVSEKFHLSPDLLYRARILVGGLLAITVILFIYILFLMMSSLAPAVLRDSFTFIVPLTICLFALLISFKVFGNYSAVVQLFVMAIAIAVIAAIIFTGGPTASPALPVTFVPVIIAFCLGGQRIGLFWAVLTFTLLYTLSAFQLMGYEFPNVGQEEAPLQVLLLNWTIAYIAIVGIVMIYEGINLRLKKELNEERDMLKVMATHDALTGVANRSKFEEELITACERHNCQHDGCVAVVYIDLDYFKPINDRLGHAAGDRVLTAIAKRLSASVRSVDTVARLGGDEFALILEGVNKQTDIPVIANKLLVTLAEPISEQGENISLSASIGISLFPEHSEDMDQLLSYADTAMYESKETHNTWTLHSEL